MIMGEATDSNCKDASCVDAKVTHDVNFYKDIIKRLKDELEKIKLENEQLRETVVAYTLKLPQVSRKLNTLVTCLEAKVYKFNRRKKRRSNGEAGDLQHSSVESSINGEDDGSCEEVQDEASEDEACQTATPPANGAHHSVQNFVEVICEEENSPGDAIIKKGYTYSETIGQKHPKVDSKDKKDFPAENDSNSSPASTKTTCPQSEKSNKVKGTNVSKVKNLREGIIKKVAKRKKPNDSKNISKDLGKNTNNASKDTEKPVPEKPISGGKGNGIAETKIKSEESVNGSAAVQSEALDNGKRTKLRRQLQESVISGRATQGTGSAVDASVSNTSDLRRRGRRRAYDCEVCGRTFARSSNLAHHVMRHRNERPHRCTICDRAFVQKANLKVHLRSHTGERPFSCPECGRAFAQKNNALRHLRAHVRQRQLQEQKLVCPCCGKAFGRWPSYETHMRRAHANSDSNAIGQITHCVGEGMANDSHVAETGMGEMCSGATHDVTNIPHQVGNNMTNSQLPVDSAHMENVHPSSINITNLHANNNINNGPLPPNHHPQSSHSVIGSQATHMAQLIVAHRCHDSSC